jgi:hypothetical protein
MMRCVIRLATDPGIVPILSTRAVTRKFRLFYCACCRLRWNLLPALGQRAVEVVEQYADGRVNAQRLRGARRSAQAVEWSVRPAWRAGVYTHGEPDAASTARLAVAATEVHARLQSGWAPDGSPVSSADQVALLRELFENPFNPITIVPAWLTPTVIALAKAIRAEQTFDQMPVLGDALQDAGCDRAELLNHCYGPGPHVAGCWLLDRLSA